MTRYARERKIDHNTDQLVVKTFLDQLRIVGLGFGNERIVCSLLHMTPMAVNKLLHENGLREWVIRDHEEQTLAKLVILLQLSNGCRNYTAEPSKITLKTTLVTTPPSQR